MSDILDYLLQPSFFAAGTFVGYLLGYRVWRPETPRPPERHTVELRPKSDGSGYIASLADDQLAFGDGYNMYEAVGALVFKEATRLGIRITATTGTCGRGEQT